MNYKVLFVCLGNICRSPIAEGVFLHYCKQAGQDNQFEVDSAGTGDWHKGHLPDMRAREVCSKNGIELQHRARQIHLNDFSHFDQILAMDLSNHDTLMALCPEPFRNKLKLMRDFDDEANRGSDVPDPYYSGPEMFNTVYQILEKCCHNFFQTLKPRLK